MVSLWADGDDTSKPSSPNPRETHAHAHDHESDERSPLIPRQPPPQRPRRDGYLDLDDPAVSPDNLWTVRLSRWLTVFFLIVTLMWWMLLLIRIFVSPPGMHSRGSGFFDFSFTTLTLGNLLVALLFFLSPSKGMRVAAAVVAGLLLVDMIIILAVKQLRREEGGPGIASIIWATLVAAWCVAADRIVAWGKREEEVRLTGRAETRRTVREWFAVLLATGILFVYILIALLMTSTLILRSSDASLEAPGQRYYVYGTRYEVHLACYGNKTTSSGTQSRTKPTIILEAGERPAEAGLAPWLDTMHQNGTVARYCYWDRPGYAFSDNAPSPHSAGMSARALSEALARADEAGPYILASAGFGSIVSRIFSSNHGPEVAGLLLVDPMHEDLLHRLASPRRGFALWARGVASPLGLHRLFAAVFGPGTTREERVYGRAAWQRGRFIKARLQENLVADSLTRNEVVSARTIQDAEVPLVLVSSGANMRADGEWREKQEDLSRLTRNLLAWEVVEEAEHEVWESEEGARVMREGLKMLLKAAE